MQADSNGTLTIPSTITDARIRFPDGSLAFPDVDYSTQRVRRRFGPLTETTSPPAPPFPLPVMPEGTILAAIVEGETVAAWPAAEVGPAIVYPGDQPPTLVGTGLTPGASHGLVIRPPENANESTGEAEDR